MNTTPTTTPLEDSSIEAADCLVIPIATTNDKSGNPRRAYVVAHRALGYIAAIDEGYEGLGVIDQELGPAVGAILRSRIMARMNVLPKTYKDALRMFGPKGERRRTITALTDPDSPLTST